MKPNRIATRILIGCCYQASRGRFRTAAVATVEVHSDVRMHARLLDSPSSAPSVPRRRARRRRRLRAIQRGVVGAAVASPPCCCCCCCCGGRFSRARLAPRVGGWGVGESWPRYARRQLAHRLALTLLAALWSVTATAATSRARLATVTYVPTAATAAAATAAASGAASLLFVLIVVIAGFAVFILIVVGHQLVSPASLVGKSSHESTRLRQQLPGLGFDLDSRPGQGQVGTRSVLGRGNEASASGSRWPI